MRYIGRSWFKEDLQAPKLKKRKPSQRALAEAQALLARVRARKAFNLRFHRVNCRNLAEDAASQPLTRSTSHGKAPYGGGGDAVSQARIGRPASRTPPRMNPLADRA